MVMIRGVDLAHDLGGTGPDVIWGHGLTSSMAGEDQMPLLDWRALRSSNRVLRYDARGHGNSGSTEVPEAYGWDELARDQLTLADELGIGAYVAAGASMGCATALHASVIAPGRIRGLVLVIPPTAWASRAAKTSTYLASADLIETGEAETVIAGAALLPPPDPFLREPRWKQRFAEVVRTTEPSRLARVLRGAATTDLPPVEEIESIAVPTLILAWTGDEGHPAATAARLQELIAGSELALAATPAGLATWSSRVETFLAAVS